MSHLIDRISAFKYNDNENSQSKDNSVNSDEDYAKNLELDSSVLTTMLKNIICQCDEVCEGIPDAFAEELEDKNNPEESKQEVSEILIESERWTPGLPGFNEQHECWSRDHLSRVDWNAFESPRGDSLLCEFHMRHGIIWSAGLTSPLPHHLLWHWTEQTWNILPDNRDHLADSCGWWYGVAFPNTKEIESVKRMSKMSYPSAFIRCRLWSRKRKRNSLSQILDLILQENNPSISRTTTMQGSNQSDGDPLSLKACLKALLKLRMKKKTVHSLKQEKTATSEEEELQGNLKSSPRLYEVDAEAWIKESFQINQEMKLGSTLSAPEEEEEEESLSPPQGSVIRNLGVHFTSKFGGLHKWDMVSELRRASETVQRMTGCASPLRRMRIPQYLLRNAKGIAIVTTAKVGFLVGGRVGSGVVLARTKSGWSAPSAIFLFGIGGGLQIGAEVGRLLLILNTDGAVRAFCGSQINLGADIGVALGPVGRHAGASVSSGNFQNSDKLIRNSLENLRKSGASRGNENGGCDVANDDKENEKLCQDEGIELGSMVSNDKEKSIEDQVEQLPTQNPQVVIDDDDEDLSYLNVHKETIDDNEEEEINRVVSQVGGAEDRGSGAAIFAYAYQKGLFMSVLSLEGTIITPRFDVNQKFYENKELSIRSSVHGIETVKNEVHGDELEEDCEVSCTPTDLLSGKVSPPKAADKLYDALYDAFDHTYEVRALTKALAIE